MNEICGVVVRICEPFPDENGAKLTQLWAADLAIGRTDVRGGFALLLQYYRQKSRSILHTLSQDILVLLLASGR